MEYLNMLVCIFTRIDDFVTNSLITLIKNYGGYFLTVLVGRIIYMSEQRKDRLKKASIEYASVIESLFLKGIMPAKEKIKFLKQSIALNNHIYIYEIPSKESAFALISSQFLSEKNVPDIQTTWFYDNLERIQKKYCDIDFVAKHEPYPTNIKLFTVVCSAYWIVIYVLSSFWDGSWQTLTWDQHLLNCSVLTMISFCLAVTRAVLKKAAMNWLGLDLSWL